MDDRRRTMVERVDDTGFDAARMQQPSSPLSTPNDIPVARPSGRSRTVVEPIGADASSSGTPAAVPVVGGSGGSWAGPPSPADVRPPGASESVQPDCEQYRPTKRPPTAYLVVLDDGSRSSGECVRLRTDRTVVGRETGDVLIGHDCLMSNQHAAITRQLRDGQYHWLLRDLGSTNGTLVRVYRLALRKDQEVGIGGGRYRFRQAQAQSEGAPAPPPSQYKSTMGWQAVTHNDIRNMYPSLVEQLPGGQEGRVLSLNANEMLLGADAAKCSLVIENDPFVSGVHAKVSQKKNGKWMLQDAGSVNGIWLRVDAIPLDANCEIQMGEQRFLFRLSPAN